MRFLWRAPVFYFAELKKTAETLAKRPLEKTRKKSVAKMLWRQSERDIGLNALMLIELQLKYGCVLLFQRNLSDKTIITDRKDFLWDRHLQKKS